MTKPQLLEKSIGILFALACILALAPRDCEAMIIVLGQAHFVSTYVYQYKGGKIDRKYLLPYVLIFIPLFYATSQMTNFTALFVVTAVYFVHHWWLDERHLLSEAPSILSGLESAPFFFMYCALIFYNFRLLDLCLPVAMLGAMAMLLHAWVSRRRGIPFGVRNAYFLALNLGCLVFCIAKPSIPPQELMAFIVLAHYVHWYVNYFFKFSTNSQLRRSYLLTIGVINVVMVALYALYRAHTAVTGLLHYVFWPPYFYAWTLMHILFVTRLKDKGFFVARPRASAVSS